MIMSIKDTNCPLGGVFSSICLNLLVKGNSPAEHCNLEDGRPFRTKVNLWALINFVAIFLVGEERSNAGEQCTAFPRLCSF